MLAPLLLALAGAVVLVTAGGWTAGIASGWAFNFLIFVPGIVRWIAAGLLVFAALPPVWRQRGRLARLGVRAWVAVPLSMVVFWLLRERTWHGDAFYKVALLERMTLQTNPYVWKEPLDSLIEHGGTELVRLWGWPPETAIAIASVLAGGVYVLAIWRAAERLAGTTLCRLGYQVGLLALGSSLLWFGHIENYSWATAVTMLTVALALRFPAGPGALWPVGLAAGAAVSFHPQALFAMPALLLLPGSGRRLARLAVLAITGLVAPLATVLAYRLLQVPWPDLSGGFAGDSQLFWTFAQMVAPGQIREAANNLWLVAPLWPLWLGAGVWGWTWPALRRDPVFRYATAAAVGLLVYHFTFQNNLARPRDWDLFAIVGPPVTLWGIYAWLQLSARLRPSLQATALHSLGVGLLFAAMLTTAWIGLNATQRLLQPSASQRELYARYRLQDLTERLEAARVTPDTPICAEPAGCARVALTEFRMPQTGDRRPTIFAHAPAEISFSLSLPAEPTFLWISPALDPVAWDRGGDGVTFQIRVRSAESEATLWERHLTPADPADRYWQDAFVPLDAYRGETVDLVLATTPGPAGNDAADRSGWGMPWLMQGTYDWRGARE